MQKDHALIKAKVSQINQLIKKFFKEHQYIDYGDFRVVEDGDDWCLKAYFSKLPFRHGGKQNLCVLVNGKIKFRSEGKQLILCHYMTEVSYLLIKNFNNPRFSLVPISGFHFDFEGAKNNHPVFHVQHKKRTYERFLSESTEFGISAEVGEELLREPSHGSIRIPTTQMDPFSVVVMIIADHIISQSEYAEFKEFTAEMEKHIPLMSFTGCSAPLVEDASQPRINRWYPNNIA